MRADASEGPEEVRELAHAFNDMVSRLDLLIGTQEQFVADASHQLRSPLTALRLRIENLEHEVGPEVQDELDSAIDEVDRLSRLVNGLLALARADRRAPERAELEVGRDRPRARRGVAGPAAPSATSRSRWTPPRGLRALAVAGRPGAGARQPDRQRPGGGAAGDARFG